MVTKSQLDNYFHSKYGFKISSHFYKSLNTYIGYFLKTDKYVIVVSKLSTIDKLEESKVVSFKDKDESKIMYESMVFALKKKSKEFGSLDKGLFRIANIIYIGSSILGTLRRI